MDEMDLEEYDDLIDGDISGPQNIKDVSTSHSSSNADTDDDCIEVGAGSRTTRTNSITTGVGGVGLLIDRDFSLEYSYMADVR